MKLRVMIVDDHKIFRQSLRYILERDLKIEVVAEAGNGSEAIARAADTHPDIVCMDVHMPALNGIETTYRLLADRPGIKVIGLSAYSIREYAQAMLDAGAVGYVTKGEAGDELLRAIRAAALGQIYLSEEISAVMANTVPKVAAA